MFYVIFDTETKINSSLIDFKFGTMKDDNKTTKPINDGSCVIMLLIDHLHN